MTIKNPRPIRELLKPAPLRPGDTVAVISPAGPADKTRLQAGLRQLARWGCNAIAGDHAQGRRAYFSGHDAERLDDLVNAFTNPDVHALFCSRGGYGSGRLLTHIPYDLIAQNPKIFLGFSDATALNWALFARTKLVTFTGPTVSEMGDGLSKSACAAFQSMIGPNPPPDPIWKGPLRTVRPGSAVGPLFPGCLSIIVSLLGTDFLPDLDGAILLIEDVGEKPYRIDRMLTHLKNAGILGRLSALLVGQMIDCWPKASRQKHLSLDEILLELTASHPLPIYAGLPYSHHPDRISLPVGVKAEISADGGLRLLEDPLKRS